MASHGPGACPEVYRPQEVRSLLWPFSVGRVWRLGFTLLGLRWIVQETYRKLHPQASPAEVSLVHTRDADLRDEILAHDGLPTTGLRGLINRANELYNLEIITYEVRLSRLPAEFDGFTVVQLSDTHHVPIISSEFTRRCVEMALDLSPDMVALTGDYQYYPPHVQEAAALLAPVGEWSRRERGGKGVFAVLGNHDVGSGRGEVTNALRKSGIPVLDNANVRLERRREPLHRRGSRIRGRGVPISKRRYEAYGGAVTLHSCSPTCPTTWWKRLESEWTCNCRGTITAGRYRFLCWERCWKTSRYGRRYVEGFYKREGTLMYVSRGLAGKPAIRWRARPDITRLILRATD